VNTESAAYSGTNLRSWYREGDSVQVTGWRPPNESAVQLHSSGLGSGSVSALAGSRSVRLMTPATVLLVDVTLPVPVL
jgi:hypothetical protein